MNKKLATFLFALLPVIFFAGLGIAGTVLSNSSAEASTPVELSQPEKIALIIDSQACGDVRRWACPALQVISICADPATPGNYLGMIKTNAGSQSKVLSAYSAPLDDWLSRLEGCEKAGAQ